MKNTLTALFLASFLAGPGYEAAVVYFSRERGVTVSAPDRQNYVVVDPDMWKFARADLADLRLFDGQAQIPYALIEQSGGSSTQDSPARLLNLGKVFINRAQIQGRKAVNDRSGPDLGNSTLYDFTAEGLGSNYVLKFPTSSFPYLHVRLAPGISPSQVKGAYVAYFSETKAAWVSAGSCAVAPAVPKQSVFACSLFEGGPLQRITFEMPANAVNFNRTVVVSDEKGNELGRGSISRVRLSRAGQTVVSENLVLDLNLRTTNHITAAVENGDDAALPIQQVRPLGIERRLYFDPRGKSELKLYYGDPKLEAPSYDYRKFFQPSSDAAVARVNPGEANSQFTGRPDDRPWSERHSGVLWITMLVAVVLLGGLALRGLKAGAPTGTQ